MLAMLEEALFKIMTSEQDEQDWKQWQLAVLKCDCLGTLRYGGEAFTQAARSRFAFNFDYDEHVADAVERLGWDGCSDARRFANIQMLDAPPGPDLSLDMKLILEATALEQFSDAIWEADIDVDNMHDLHPVDFYALGMDIHQASNFMLYTREPNGEVWPIGFQQPEVSSSETASYESVYSLPE